MPDSGKNVSTLLIPFRCLQMRSNNSASSLLKDFWNAEISEMPPDYIWIMVKMKGPWKKQ